jgi:hypothetical protein
LAREQFDIKRRLFGPEDFYTLASMDNLPVMLPAQTNSPRRRNWNLRPLKFTSESSVART